RVIERRNVPQADPLERKFRQYLEAVGRETRPAHVQPAQLRELAELGEAEIGDLQSAGHPAIAAAWRRRFAAAAEIETDAEVEIFEAGQERNRVEIEVGDARRPAGAGVAPLKAFETQLLELRQQLEKVQVDAGDHVAAEGQLLEIGEGRQIFQPDVFQHRMAQV